MLTIQVKDEHILHGERSFCDSCAIALAFSEIFPKANNIEIQNSKYLKVDYQMYVAADEDCKNVDDFIRNFDTGRIVEPFSFKVEAQPS